MPFYEYQCRACGELTEVLQKVSDAPLRKCPACGKNQLTKLVSAPVFRLKGSGWYETDFKSENDKKRNLVGEDKDEAKPAAEAKSETKDKPAEAAAKPEPKAAAPKAKPVKSKAKAKPAPRKAAGKKR